MRMWETVESLLIIAVIAGGLIWYALVLGWREDREARSAANHAKLQKFTSGARSAGQKATQTGESHDPDAHLGHTGSE